MSSFDKYLDAHLAAIEGSYTASEEAQRFLSWMRENHPEVLNAWLFERALQTIATEITRRDRSDRAKARHRAKPRAFAEAAAAGDPEGFVSVFDIVHVVNGDYTRTAARDMTGPEHLYVAKSYRTSAKQAAMLAAFHTAVAEKVGDRRTCEVLGREEYERMYVSLTGGEAA